MNSLLVRGRVWSRDIAAEVRLNSQRLKHRGLGGQGLARKRLIRSVGDLNVVRTMTRHELISGDSWKDGVHHRPLWGRDLPAPLSLRTRQQDGLQKAQIHFESIRLDI